MPLVFAPRVLVVEDEPELLDEVASYLRRRGETVETATSCKEARRILEDDSKPIDVLISDARMPDGNGIDLIRAHTERVGDRCICILMTGHLERSQITADLDELKIFYKPFAVSTLHREMRSAIAGAWQKNGIAAGV
jgi:DNA-binding NtrC family response regulator